MECAEQSASLGEPLAGTAAHATTWLLVEEPGAWAPKVLDSPGIAPIREQLERWMTDGSPDEVRRIQLIRRPGQRRDGERLFYEADVRRETLVCWRGDVAATRIPLEDSLLLVCTHGKRDNCCATRGRPVFDALTAVEGNHQVWQTSHLGGHRFAATLLRLPDGYCLGRVQPGDAASVRAALDEQRLGDLGRVRGNVKYGGALQCAELAARAHWAELRASAVRAEILESTERGVRVRVARGDDALEVTVTTTSSGHFAKSCDAEASDVPGFRAEVHA